MSILSFIEDLFLRIFDATRLAWKHIPSDIQDKIKSGSSIVNILIQFIGQDPKLTIATLQANVSINLDELYTTLSVLANFWKIAVPPTLEDLIVAIQAYLKGLDNSEWDRVVSMAAQTLADVLSGSATPFGIIVSVIEFVYREFIRGKDIQFAAMPAMNLPAGYALANGSQPASPALVGQESPNAGSAS